MMSSKTACLKVTIIFMRNYVITILLLLPALGRTSEVENFLTWLEGHKQGFISCRPVKNNGVYKLCDNTTVDEKLLKDLFQKSPDELVTLIKNEKINLKIFCKENNSEGVFQKYCIKSVDKRITSLHGKFLPDENTILLQSDASKGSLIHEYIHHLQYENKNLYDGKRYKFERANIQQALVKEMDGAIEKTKMLTKESEAAPYVKTVMKASSQLMKFSIWQDLIDEKNIFLLYISYGKELGASAADLELAQKNMGFICKREKLPEEQCPALATSLFTQEIFKDLKEIRPKVETKLIEEYLNNLPSLPSNAPLAEKITALNNYIFKQVKMTTDNSYLARNNMDNILPDSTLKFKQAHCLGLTILYLMAAEKMNIKAYLVRGPEHVFPRFCEKEICLNIEPLKNGEIMDDKFFIDNLFITKQSIANGIYLKNLDSPNELAASIYLGLGFVASTHKQFELAEIFYKKAIDNSHGLADAYSNLAAVYMQQGKKFEAKTYLEIALKINPDYYPALINLGAYYHNQNDSEQALKYYSNAIAINELSVDAYRRRAKIFKELQKKNESLMDLERILIIQPRFCDVIKDSLAITADNNNKNKKEKSLAELETKHECLSLPTN